MSEGAEAAVKRIISGVSSFADDMRAKGIHVGLGMPGRCVTCGETWPCAGSRGPEEETTQP